MATQAQLDQEALIRRQDELRPYRQFMSLMSGLSGADQSYTGTDTVAYNPTGQFVSVGPYGQSVEGQPIALTAQGQSPAATIQPIYFIGLAVLAVLLLK